MVQQNVKAQDFKAGAVECVVGEAGVVVMLDDGVGGDDRLDDDVLDISPDLLRVVAVALHVHTEGGELPGRKPQAVRQKRPPSGQLRPSHAGTEKLLEKSRELTGMDARGAGRQQGCVSSEGACRRYRATGLKPLRP